MRILAIWTLVSLAFSFTVWPRMAGKLRWQDEYLADLQWRFDMVYLYRVPPHIVGLRPSTSERETAAVDGRMPDDWGYAPL